MNFIIWVLPQNVEYLCFVVSIASSRYLLLNEFQAIRTMFYSTIKIRVAWFNSFDVHACKLKIGARVIALGYLKLRNLKCFFFFHKHQQQKHSHTEKSSNTYINLHTWQHVSYNLWQLRLAITCDWGENIFSWNFTEWKTGPVWRVFLVSNDNGFSPLIYLFWICLSCRCKNGIHGIEFSLWRYQHFNLIDVHLFASFLYWIVHHYIEWVVKMFHWFKLKQYFYKILHSKYNSFNEFQLNDYMIINATQRNCRESQNTLTHIPSTRYFDDYANNLD